MDKDEFWEREHSSGDLRWLTGSNPRGVLKRHELSLTGLNRIADVGVGLGGMARHLAAQGIEVVAIDCSQTALDRLTGLECECYLSSEMSKAAPCDAAICHLVIQHCDDDEVERIFCDVPLRSGGFISAQGAALRHAGEIQGDRLREELKIGMQHPRPLTRAIELAERAHLRVVKTWEWDPGFELYPDYKWWFLRAEKP